MGMKSRKDFAPEQLAGISEVINDKDPFNEPLTGAELLALDLTYTPEASNFLPFYHIMLCYLVNGDLHDADIDALLTKLKAFTDTHNTQNDHGLFPISDLAYTTLADETIEGGYTHKYHGDENDTREWVKRPDTIVQQVFFPNILLLRFAKGNLSSDHFIALTKWYGQSIGDPQFFLDKLANHAAINIAPPSLPSHDSIVLCYTRELLFKALFAPSHQRGLKLIHPPLALYEARHAKGNPQDAIDAFTMLPEDRQRFLKSFKLQSLIDVLTKDLGLGVWNSGNQHGRYAVPHANSSNNPDFYPEKWLPIPVHWCPNIISHLAENSMTLDQAKAFAQAVFGMFDNQAVDWSVTTTRVNENEATLDPLKDEQLTAIFSNIDNVPHPTDQRGIMQMSLADEARKQRLNDHLNHSGFVYTYKPDDGEQVPDNVIAFVAYCADLTKDDTTHFTDLATALAAHNTPLKQHQNNAAAATPPLSGGTPPATQATSSPLPTATSTNPTAPASPAPKEQEKPWYRNGPWWKIIPRVAAYVIFGGWIIDGVRWLVRKASGKPGAQTPARSIPKVDSETLGATTVIAPGADPKTDAQPVAEQGSHPNSHALG